MGLWMKYCRQHKRILAFYFMSMGTFLILLALYGLPLAAGIYGAALCLFWAALLGIPDFLRLRKKHRQMQQAEKNPEIMTECLPEPEGILEEDYRQLAERLKEQSREEKERMGQQYQDMTDYYTLWAHQVKTPIAAMKLSLQQEDSNLGRELSQELMRIEQYVDMAMCYLRLGAGTRDYLFVNCDIDGILRQALRKFSSSFIHKKIRLEYEELGLETVTDEKWLLFVVEQILSNSLKYTMPRGTIRIEKQGEHILCIRDTGIGIAPEDLPRIFEKGYTGYNGRSYKKASGLGLYLCREICRGLGHRIWASSCPGEGTVIYIDLRRVFQEE